MVSCHSIYSHLPDVVLLLTSTTRFALKLGHMANKIHLVTDVMLYVMAAVVAGSSTKTLWTCQRCMFSKHMEDIFHRRHCAI